MDRYVNVPLSEKDAHSLKAGDYVYLTGTIYTARDAAHKRMQETLDRGEELPLKMENNVIYYMGPSPAREGRQIGSAGPTTASRMDKYAPRLLDLGLKGMIGKGKRSKEVADAIVRNGAVYFAAVGGAGANFRNSLILYSIYEDFEFVKIHRFDGFTRNLSFIMTKRASIVAAIGDQYS